MKLFKFIDEYEKLYELFEQEEEINLETGEVTINPDKEKILTELQADLQKNFDKKAENYRDMIIGLKSDINIAREEKRKIDSYMRAKNNTIDWLKSNLKITMENLHIDKIEPAPGKKISFRKNTSYNYDEHILQKQHSELFKTILKLDKNEAKKEFKAGNIEAGIAEIKTKSIQVR